VTCASSSSLLSLQHLSPSLTRLDHTQNDSCRGREHHLRLPLPRGSTARLVYRSTLRRNHPLRQRHLPLRGNTLRSHTAKRLSTHAYPHPLRWHRTLHTPSLHRSIPKPTLCSSRLTHQRTTRSPSHAENPKHLLCHRQRKICRQSIDRRSKYQLRCQCYRNEKVASKARDFSCKRQGLDYSGSYNEFEDENVV